MSSSTDQQTPAASSLRKKLLFTTAIIVLMGAGFAFYLYHLMTGDQLKERDKHIYIKIPADINDTGALADWLEGQGVVSSKWGFKLTAWWMNYEVKAGKCKLDKTIKSHKDLIHTLKRAEQTTDLTFHNIRTKEQLAGHLARQLAHDSMTYIRLFTDRSLLDTYGVNDTTLLTLFIPDTYELQMQISPEEVLKRMAKESVRFWNEQDRLAKAAALELTPQQVYTLASIVETESQYAPERPTIAGVYLNRLRAGWKLEADPTVVFAVGDFSIRRVLRVHLETDSPYNTYKHIGLPPGPIYMASKSSIDAVLSPENHDYMFFCAKAGGEGNHAFAKTLAAHLANARTYQQWLNQQKIYK